MALHPEGSLVEGKPVQKTGRRISMTFAAAALAAALIHAGCGYFSPAAHRQRKENWVALSAKLLCSGVFVVGRDAEEFIANDLTMSNPLVPSWDEIEVTIDREEQSVTLTVEGVPPRTALYKGDQGCTLLQVGMDDVSYTPVELSSTLPDAATQAWPMGDVLPDDPLPAEVNEVELEAVLDDSALSVPQKTRAMVVVYQGRIIGERYAPGFERDTRHICWSMGKSITATLIGILVHEGRLRVEDPAPIAAWRDPGDPRNAITINDLLQMSGGLEFHRGTIGDGLILTDRDNHAYVYFAAPNVFEYSVDNALEFQPGTVWRYLNCDPLSLGKIVRETLEARGEEYLSFPQRALFDPLGMRHMVLEVDPWGNFIMTGFEYGTARDWARFGLLYLQDGVWQGERMLPEGWVDYVRTPAPANSDRAYGALFWLNAGGRYADLPRDMFWAAGNSGQHTIVIPSRDMVIVRLGHSTDGFDAYIETVITGILSSVNGDDG